MWHVGRPDDAASSTSSDYVRANDEGSDTGNDYEYARDVAFSIILQVLGHVPFPCVTHYQESPQHL